MKICLLLEFRFANMNEIMATPMVNVLQDFINGVSRLPSRVVIHG